MNRRNMIASCSALGLSFLLPKIKNYYTVYTDKVTKLKKKEITTYNGHNIEYDYLVNIKIGNHRMIPVHIGFNNLALAEHFFNTANNDKFKMLIKTPFGIGAVTCDTFMEVV